MNYCLIILGTLISLSLHSNATSDGFIELTDDNYINELTDHDALVIFYSEWMEDLKEKSIDALRGIRKVLDYQQSNYSKLVYCISSQKEYLLLNKYKIMSPYPKIMLIQNNNISHLFQHKSNIKETTFDINGISNWIINKTSKEIPVITSITQLEDLRKLHEVFICIIGDDQFIQSFFKEKLLDAFTSLSFYQIKDLSIIQKIDKLIARHHDLDNKIIIFKQFDTGMKVITDETFSGFLSIEDFEKLIKIHAYPFITSYSFEDYIDLISNKKNFTLILLPKENADNKDALGLFISSINDHCEELREETKFLQANYDQLYQTAIMNDFDLNNNDQPVILVFKYSMIDNMYFKYKEEVNLAKPKTFHDFYGKYKNNLIKRYMRSEPSNTIPLVKDNINNVYKLIGRNFDEIVNAKNKDAYAAILFIRENCFHCDQMQSNLKEIAKEMKNDSLIIFGIIDGYKNEVDNVIIKEYPSLILFKPGQEKMTNYAIMEYSKHEKNSIRTFLQIHIKKRIDNVSSYDKKTDL